MAVKSFFRCCIFFLAFAGQVSYAWIPLDGYGEKVIGPDIHVSPLGNDANSGAEDAPLLTLAKAAEKANALSDVNTVRFLPGVYASPSSVSFTQPVALVGEDATIDAVLRGLEFFSLSNLTLKHDVLSYGLYILRGGSIDHCVFAGNPITSNLGTAGVLLACDEDVDVTNNTFKDYGVGLEAQRGIENPAPSYVLRNNTFLRCRAGVLGNSCTVNGGISPDLGGNVFKDCPVAVSNVFAILQFFDGCQFILRDTTTGVPYALTDESLIRISLIRGEAHLVSIANPQPLPFSPADIDQDGGVTATDVQLTINGALGIGELVIDIDDDGATTATDIQIVINVALQG